MKKYNSITPDDLEKLRSMVTADRFSTGESNLALHSIDQSIHKPSLPEAVIWPVTEAEVVSIMKYADERVIPITGWGSGSSLEGNPIPVNNGIVLDFSQMNRILEIREEDFQADVEPGVIYRDLNRKLRHKGLFFPPDPGADATIGGMIANNASGTRTVKYGSTRSNLLRLTVVLANGEVINLGTRSSKCSSGYDLINLFVGSEGTLGIVVRATVRLTGIAEEFSAAVVTFPSVEDAGSAVFDIIRSGLDPASLELLGPECIEVINSDRELGLKEMPTLFIEYHGPSKDYLAELNKMTMEICREHGAIDYSTGLGLEERDRLFSARHELSEIITRTHPESRFLNADVAVPITAFPEIIETARMENEKRSIKAYIFSHAGDGNLHLRMAAGKDNEQEWELVKEANQMIVSKAISLGGTCTGEHGVGIGKMQYMTIEHGNSLVWMKKIKELFDPKGILNPGKIFSDTQC